MICSEVRYTLKRSEILRGRKNFQLVLTKGRKIEGKILSCLVYHGLKTSHRGVANVAFGVAVPRAIKKAVDRNHIKRVTREAFRLNKHIISFGVRNSAQTIGLLFVLKLRIPKTMPGLSFSDINNEMKSILESVGRMERRSDIS